MPWLCGACVCGGHVLMYLFFHTQRLSISARSDPLISPSTISLHICSKPSGISTLVPCLLLACLLSTCMVTRWSRLTKNQFSVLENHAWCFCNLYLSVFTSSTALLCQCCLLSTCLHLTLPQTSPASSPLQILNNWINATFHHRNVKVFLKPDIAGAGSYNHHPLALILVSTSC